MIARYRRLYAAQDPSRARIASVAVTPRVGDSHVSQKLRWASSAPIRTASAVPGTRSWRLNEDGDARSSVAAADPAFADAPCQGTGVASSAPPTASTARVRAADTRHAGPLATATAARCMRPGTQRCCQQQHAASPPDRGSRA